MRTEFRISLSDEAMVRLIGHAERVRIQPRAILEAVVEDVLAAMEIEGVEFEVRRKLDA